MSTTGAVKDKANPISAANEGSNNSIYAGIARSALRGLTLYFSRPVRLFKPVKASGWTSLRYAAQRDGATLSPKYLSEIIKRHGVSVIPRHFFPPLIANTFLGTLLFTSYTSINDGITRYSPETSSTLIAGISGAAAGAIQAIAGAPADNVRSLMEQGAFHPETSVSGWRHAWKEVFRGTQTQANGETLSALDKRVRLREMREMREVRAWVHEVRGMAGNGWDGWGWSCAKDICGFALFFALFDVSRQVAVHASDLVESRFGKSEPVQDPDDAFTLRKKSTIARVAQGTVLVAGGATAGACYEYVGRPFDIIRHEWHIRSLGDSATIPPPTNRYTHPVPPPRLTASALTCLVVDIIRERGPQALFHSIPGSSAPRPSSPRQSWRGRLYPALRTLARVGPWGAGFLVWEAFGPGIQ